MTIVLDASALLAYLNDETGADKVDQVISNSLISTVNWSEVLQKSLSRGIGIEGLREDVEALGLIIEGFPLADSVCAAELWQITRMYGLSLGDRACLAFAIRRQIPILTADKAWLNVASILKLDIQVIR